MCILRVFACFAVLCDVMCVCAEFINDVSSASLIARRFVVFNVCCLACDGCNAMRQLDAIEAKMQIRNKVCVLNAVLYHTEEAPQLCIILQR